MKNALRFYVTHSRSRRDRLLACWAAAMGMLNIFLNGTFVIFSAGMNTDSFKGSYETSLWTLLGRADQRFVLNDSFLVTSAALQSLVVGPLLLAYAWTTYVRAPQRHVLGIVSSTFHIYSWILFYGIEIHSDFIDLNNSLTTPLVIASAGLYVLLPALVLLAEARAAVRATARHDYHKMLRETGSTSFGGITASGPGSDVDSNFMLPFEHRQQQHKSKSPRHGGSHRSHDSALKLGSLFPSTAAADRRSNSSSVAGLGPGGGMRGGMAMLTRASKQQQSHSERHYLEADAASETGTALSLGDSQYSFQGGGTLHRPRNSSSSIHGGNKAFAFWEDRQQLQPPHFSNPYITDINHTAAAGLAHSRNYTSAAQCNSYTL